MPRRIILGSGSPRRREILALLRLPFDVVESGFQEEHLSLAGTEGPWHGPLTTSSQVESLAIAKAMCVLHMIKGRPGHLILTADTVVVADSQDGKHVLGKPADQREARAMLKELSGATHQVLTGVGLLNTDRIEGGCICETKVVTTEVTFRRLTPEMIDAYIATGEPFDKAGAYGIQGYASAFVETISGDYFNVVGLPIHTVAKMLEEIGIEWWRGPAALG